MRGCCAFVSSICCTSVIPRWPSNGCSERPLMVHQPPRPRTRNPSHASLPSLLDSVQGERSPEAALSTAVFLVEHVDVDAPVIDPGLEATFHATADALIHFHGHAADHASRASCHRFITRASSRLSLRSTASDRVRFGGTVRVPRLTRVSGNVTRETSRVSKVFERETPSTSSRVFFKKIESRVDVFVISLPLSFSLSLPLPLPPSLPPLARAKSGL